MGWALHIGLDHANAREVLLDEIADQAEEFLDGFVAGIDDRSDADHNNAEERHRHEY